MVMTKDKKTPTSDMIAHWPCSPKQHGLAVTSHARVGDFSLPNHVTLC